MDEEISNAEPEPKYVTVCKCLLNDDSSSEQVFISERKQKILTIVSRTENYLRDHCISELIQYLFTKLIAQQPQKPIVYLENLLNNCMLFRAGHGVPPVIYEIRHLQAIIKSFDPGQRGWLSPGQVRRAFATIGLTPEKDIQEKNSWDEVLCSLIKAQEIELYYLLGSGGFSAEKS